MPTLQQLADEITQDPQSLGYAEYVSSGNDSGILELLTTRNLPGYVTGDDLQKSLLQSGALAHLDFIKTHLLLPSAQDVAPSVPAPYGLIFLATRLLHAIEFNRRVSIEDITIGSAVLISVSLMTTENRDALLALEQKINRVQFLWGLDESVSLSSIALALGRG